MQDLSSEVFPDGPISALVPSSQSDGGEPHRNRAMTAPGIDPPLEVVRLANETDVHPPPEVQAIEHGQRTSVERARDRGTRIVPGTWNDLGGGPAPERR